ncbi:hypothetical protein ACWIG5_02230 [Streptomyces lydicus]
MDNDTPPPFAELKAGVTVSDISEAISKSGYPFQAVVAEALRNSDLRNSGRLEIQEEWAYIDRESGQARSVDILANVAFKDDEGAHRINAGLSLIIECKKSDLPYVFFLRPNPPADTNGFPEIHGLTSSDIRLVSNEAEEEGKKAFSAWMRITDALYLHELPFFDAPAPYAISLTKAMRRGPRLELTGEEAYRSLTLPLLKAADHLHALSAPRKERRSRHPTLVVNLAVIKAPMVGTFLHAGEQELISLPWVRVSYLEPKLPAAEDGGKPGLQGNVHYFDVVHDSFLPRYLEVLARDARKAAERLHEHSVEIAAGVGYSDFSEGHRHLRPLEDDHSYDLTEPCTIHIDRMSNSLAISVDRSKGEISSALLPSVVGWIDGYPWLDESPAESE